MASHSIDNKLSIAEHRLHRCKSLGCVWFCDPVDCSPPGSSVHGILQARILEWVAMPSFRGSSWPRDWTQVSCIAGGFFAIWAPRKPNPNLSPPVIHATAPNALAALAAFPSWDCNIWILPQLRFSHALLLLEGYFINFFQIRLFLISANLSLTFTPVPLFPKKTLPFMVLLLTT